MHPLSGSVLLRRVPWCLLPLVLGAGAALLLLLVAGGPTRLARAAPGSLSFPGCGATIQACLDTAAVGETIVIQPNTYITSLTLSRAVSLTGVNSATVILQALSGQRVLTVTGAAVDSSVVISGLTFTGGSAVGIDCPAGCGGRHTHHRNGAATPRLPHCNKQYSYVSRRRPLCRWQPYAEPRALYK